MPAGIAADAAGAVSEQRLWQLLMDVARYGATSKGGVNRPALSTEDIEAKRHLVDWARQRGFDCYQDEMANLFIRREGGEPDLAAVMTGSHLDSQPTGGRFDGAYGVLAGLEVLDALESARIQTRRAIEVVAWTNEEGSRFSPGAMGSSVFAGVRSLASVLGTKDRAGISLQESLAAAIAAVPAAVRPRSARNLHGYIEAHIEQGPILEQTGIPIGAVVGVQGICRLDVQIVGVEAHAGTTPRSARKDAFAAAVAVAAQLQALARDEADAVRFTIGRCEVLPGSPNTIPGLVRFTIDLRHPVHEVLRDIADRIRPVARQAGKPCEVEVSEVSYVPPTRFDPDMVKLIEDWCGALGYPCRVMPSGAGHDAMHLSKVCRTGMIFVPCRNGISHNEAEDVTPAQVAAGARVLAAAMMDLAAS